MRFQNKYLVALCLALIACLAAPALLPAELGAPFSARAAAALNRTKATVYNGKTLKLAVTGTKKTVKWSSSDPKVAKVDQKGLVTAKKAGKATITAVVGGKKLTCAVTVKSSLTASPAKLTLKPGETKKVTLTYKLSGRLSMEKYDASVLKCTLGRIARGKCTLTVKALRPGTQTLKVKNSKSSDVAKINVTVLEAQPTDPVVDKTAVTVAVGETATVNVKWPYSGIPRMWLDDSKVVECTWGEWNGDGWPLYIRGVGAGTAKVWLTRGDDSDKYVMAEINVTVN